MTAVVKRQKRKLDDSCRKVTNEKRDSSQNDIINYNSPKWSADKFRSSRLCEDMAW